MCLCVCTIHSWPNGFAILSTKESEVNLISGFFFLVFIYFGLLGDFYFSCFGFDVVVVIVILFEAILETSLRPPEVWGRKYICIFSLLDWPLCDLETHILQVQKFFLYYSLIIFLTFVILILDFLESFPSYYFLYNKYLCLFCLFSMKILQQTY